jgi:hypothetical protein
MRRFKGWMHARGLPLVLCLGLLAPVLSTAVPSKQYVNRETDLVLRDTGGTHVFTLSALAANAGQYSARIDRGSASHAGNYVWRCTVQLTGANIPGAPVEVYLATSDGTNTDGQLGTTSAALPTDKRNNLTQLGTLSVDQGTSNTNMTASGVFASPARYLWLALWNGTTLPLKTDTAVHSCVLTPWSIESQ